MTVESEGWQYGVKSVIRGEELTAVDPAGQNLYGLGIATQVAGLMPGGASVSGSLLLGAQNRLYSFMNSSMLGRAQCVYQTVPTSVKRLMLDSARFANFTWAKDSVDYGEAVHIFRDSTLEVGQMLHPEVLGQVDPPHPVPPSPAVSVVRIDTTRSLLVSGRRQQPVRIVGGIGVPSAFWDRLAGFQGSSVAGNVSEFAAGRPAASFFKVPESWEPCQEIPHPPPASQAGSLPLLGLPLAWGLHDFGVHMPLQRPASSSQPLVV